MAHEMQSFEHMICERNVSLHTLMIDGAPWFRGTDVAHALGYAKPHQAICHHVEEEDRAQLKDVGLLLSRTPLKHNEGAQIFISESGLYLCRGAFRHPRMAYLHKEKHFYNSQRPQPWPTKCRLLNTVFVSETCRCTLS